MTQSKLIYVHDPMCSWCWGFVPTWLKLKSELENNFKDILTIEYKVGGLAPDSQAPMTQNMQDMLQNTWRKIAAQLGTQFNYAFWQECQPRRSTYPACRAALIARKANKEADMVAAIQHAYYLNAQNPSDENTLIELAQHIGLDKADFESSLQSHQINDELNKELAYAHSLPIQGFPSLVLINNNNAFPIDINYTDWQQSFNQISAFLK
ncbi:DsbA family protein [Pseudoalteromonas sp. MMG007]|uniref:DsbA family protein n=1 Tax=Pseudoalteromonas sp. MMG007 TaxID=2822684 RepID=UPI001B37DD63|nr:DsbA family protein [Pseudoalteromonas sp. MMG007]MBQ4859287.1 DsbA family protein [Pseudoalteromonas sp. MMG007]